MRDPARLQPLVRAIARGDGMAGVVNAMQDHALKAASGRSSVILRGDPATGALYAWSAMGVADLAPEPWFTGRRGEAAARKVWASGEPTVITRLPELTSRLGTPAALAAPLVSRHDLRGMLVVGLDEPDIPDAARAEIASIADLLTLLLDRAHLGRQAELQQEVRELGLSLTRAVSSAQDMDASLEIFCDRARTLFAADRVSIWLHDRRARAMDLVASSDAGEIAARRRIATDDPLVPVSLAMRTDRAEILATDGATTLTILAPLRGRRRALGTLEVAGLRVEPGEAPAIRARLDEAATLVSAVVESVLLLDDLLRSRRELESTFNSLADLVVVSDGRLRVSHANQAFAARVGRRAAELIDRPLADFFGADLVGWVERLGTAGRGGSGSESESRELDDPTLGGTFLFTVSPLIGRDDKRLGAVVVASDVSEQARMQAERVELRDRLTQSEKLAALGQFVAGIAHELNNPLQGVLGHLELMLQDTAQFPPRSKRDLKLVFREAERAAKIVHNLLVFAGSRRISRRRLNVNHVVTRVVRLRAATAAASSIEIVQNLAPRLPRVAGDALLLQQALLNIVMNAEQALATRDTPRRLELRSRRLGRRMIEIQVVDNGPGIPADAMPRLFEPFFTTKEVGQGTGLGLAIAYGIMQEHDGQLSAANRPEGGAVFTLELPVGENGVE